MFKYNNNNNNYKITKKINKINHKIIFPINNNLFTKKKKSKKK